MGDRSAYWRERSRRRRKDPAYRRAQSARCRAWYLNNKDDKDYRAQKAAAARVRREDPGQAERIAARMLLRNAVRRGEIQKRSCFCGAVDVHGHHEDYSRPLDVIWLCPPHHREVHAKATGDTR